MPIFLVDKSNSGYIMGVWEVTEGEEYFLNNLTLSLFDQELLNRAKNPKRRLEILSVRLLAKSLGLSINIRYSDTGKPKVENGNISISHSKGFSAIIYHKDSNVTIDIEKPSNIIAKSKHLVFNSKEIEFAGNNLKLLTTLWCCKECVVKLTNDLKVNYLTQINIHPFGKNSIIECDYKDKIKHYKFYHSCINNHIIVWGIDDS